MYESDSYVHLSADDMQQLRDEVIKGIHKYREKRRQLIIKFHNDYKERYRKTNYFMKLLLPEPYDHPKDKPPDGYNNKNEYQRTDSLSSNWENFVNLLADSKKEVYISANHLKSLKKFTVL